MYNFIFQSYQVTKSFLLISLCQNVLLERKSKILQFHHHLKYYTLYTSVKLMAKHSIQCFPYIYLFVATTC